MRNFFMNIVRKSKTPASAGQRRRGASVGENARFPLFSDRLYHARMQMILRIRSSIRRVSLLLAAILFVCAALPCGAQTPDSPRFFDDALQQIGNIRKQLADGDIDDTKLNTFRDSAAALADQADALAADLTPKLAAVRARLVELGPAPAKGTTEAPDIASQRADLVKQDATLDAEIKRAKLLSVNSQQLTGEIADARRANFQARLTQRTASPLTPTFWRDLANNAERDGAHLTTLRDGAVAALSDAFAIDNLTYTLGGIIVGLLLVFGVRAWVVRVLMRLTANRVPQGRLRRSAFALAMVTVITVFTGLGMQAVVSGLDWHGAFSTVEMNITTSLVRAVFFGSFVAGLGSALLSPARPSWRLPAIPDRVAQRLRLVPPLFGLAAAFAVLVHRINGLVNASLAATIAATLAVALLDSLLIAWVLIRAGSDTHYRDPGGESGQVGARPVWLSLAFVMLWAGVIVALLAIACGYIAFANLLARQMVWLGIVAAALYLLVHLVEDLFAAMVASRAGWAQRALGLESRILDQLTVLFSGAFRVIVFLFALVVAFAPFGTEPADLIARGSQSIGILSFGQIQITPSAVLGAMLVIALGTLAVRVLRTWLGEHYLPTTRLDPGMRSSVTTLLGYAGMVVVFALALSELGLSIERIAWIASALSVGIGFGLQAVVQNFVSGLILLAERPVKVGDWVVLDSTEGDIRRINVRATEIQLADRSTVIVPNSDLITKSVRNVTHGNAEGRVRVRVPLPLDTDAERARALMRAALDTQAGLLHTPAPSVLLDGIDGGALIFIVTAYIANPRQSTHVRSELLFDILARLRAEEIALSSPYDVKLREPARVSAANAAP
jgi:small-conductance mechanosensitive channel